MANDPEQSLKLLFAGLPTHKKIEFLVSSVQTLSNEQCAEIQNSIDRMLRRDFITLFRECSQIHIAEKILSYLDASSLAAAEKVCPAWCAVIRGGNLWQRLIQIRVLSEELWDRLSIQLDLKKYFRFNTVCQPNGVTDHIPGDYEFGIQTKGLSDLSEVFTQDYAHQHSDFYRSLYFTLCRLAERIQQNWAHGRYNVKRITCHTNGSRGVYCLQYDTRYIVCGVRDGSVQVYNKMTLECERILIGHLGSVLCLQYENQLLISGSSDSTVRFWSLLNGFNLHTIRHHRSGVLSLRFKDDTLVTGSRDHTVCVWKIRSPTDVRLLTSLHGHRASVVAVEFDDRFILSASGDRLVQVWDFQVHEYVRSLVGHRRGVTCLHYEKGIAITGSSDLTVRIWTVETGLCLRILEGHNHLVRCLRFDMQRIICGSYDGKIRIWNLQDAMNRNSSGAQLCAITLAEHKNRIFRLQFDPLQIVSSSLDNTVVIWNFFTQV
ncbi:hypothetical protein CRM22_007420 [Opisthorchis felineus]|uniref:F-box domain-containing protein n=1 Tax=Opisthorchis felineus TaxID=147828 RepID=A0A4S2LGM4_OPIFE|nr:hypothetical protein CRM22_007420 [Opisthorchis felineus]TGZ62491.1 hypothetical protein CRM22_007420 [Opisthorchis felineus]